MAENVTASAIISFTEKLEDRSTAFYQQLAGRFTEQEATFLGFAKEGGKNKTLVVRTYRETISDALEACFSFEGVDLAAYRARTTGHLDDVALSPDYAAALAAAVELEEQAIGFYQDVAKRSQSLMATIPMAFRRVAKTRGKRKLELQTLLEEAE
jgi:rubrerythrin